MQKILLISLIILQGCNMNSPSVNPKVEQLVEPPDIRTANSRSGSNFERGQDMQNTLHENQWQLTRYYTEQGMRTVLIESPVSLQFSGRKVSGSSGCNRYFASYQLMGDDILKISQSGSTMMACIGSVAAQEQQYLKNLTDINFYQFQDEQLRLYDAQRQLRLVFKSLPALSLEHTAWQVTGINNGTGGVVSSAQTAKAHLQFNDGKLHGSTGCNALTATYKVQGSELSMGSVGITRKLCAEKDLMIQEQQLLMALSKVKRFEIRANQLRLVNADGSLMLRLMQK